MVGDAAPRARSFGMLPAGLSIATAITILAVGLLILMSPLWMQPVVRAATTATFATPDMAAALSDRTIGELFFGPGSFAYYAPDEAAHMRDVRLVLWIFLVVAAASAALLVAAVARRGREPRTWRAIARGGAGLVAVLAVLGVFAAVAFGVAFELFHRIFFPGGNWEFPADSLLIRLYPYEFWQWSAAALAVLTVGGGAMTWFVARRRARALERSDAR